jgi:uncharacterized protein (TIGR03000 family)
MSYTNASTQLRPSSILVMAGSNSITTTRIQPHESTSIHLNAKVPSGAKIYVNGRLTKGTAAVRKFVSRNLGPGKRYYFTVRAEMMDSSGQLISETKQISMTSGETGNMEFTLLGNPTRLTAVEQEARHTDG